MNNRQFIDTIEHNLTRACGVAPGASVVVALSGGADSVALLHGIVALTEKLKLNITAAHMNHMIRGEEAETDEAFVVGLCQTLGVTLETYRFDVPAFAERDSLTLETAARIARYDFLRRVKNGVNAEYIAIAHHMDDQAESVLQHLIRGSGLKGLTGMDYRAGDIIRPMLSMCRKNILSYIKSNGLSYRTDSSNLIADSTRNRLRLDVIPYIKENINPRVCESICSAARLLSEDEAYLNEIASNEFENARLNVGFDRHKIAALPMPIRSRALRLAIADAGVCVDIQRKHIAALREFLGARTGSRLDIPHISAYISYDAVLFSPIFEREEYCVPLCIDTPTTVSGFSIIARESDPNTAVFSPHIACMDLDKLTLPLTIRCRQDGDRFWPIGSAGTKKLKDILIDKKIPRHERNMPIICDASGKIVYCYGLCVSDDVKISKNTTRMLKVSFYKECNLRYN